MKIVAALVTAIVGFTTIRAAASDGVHPDPSTDPTALAALATGKECSDTSTEFSIRNKKRGCDWLRRQKQKNHDRHCDRVEVQQACPKTCSICTIPTRMPSPTPSSKPSLSPTQNPTSVPSPKPSSNPMGKPSSSPSTRPSPIPTRMPSPTPSSKPSSSPTPKPTSHPSANPSSNPMEKPSSSPSAGPSPSQTTSSVGCMDTSIMFSIRNKSKGCNWLRKKRKRVSSHCDRGEVQIACPKTCFICGHDVSTLTAKPSATPTQTPASSAPTPTPTSKNPSPTEENDCSDTSTKFVIQDRSIPKRCGWLRRKKAERIDYHCDQEEVRHACPKTCCVCGSCNAVAGVARTFAAPLAPTPLGAPIPPSSHAGKKGSKSTK